MHMQYFILPTPHSIKN